MYFILRQVRQVTMKHFLPHVVLFPVIIIRRALGTFEKVHRENMFPSPQHRAATQNTIILSFHIN